MSAQDWCGSKATIHISPDDDAEAILSALGDWLRRKPGRLLEVRPTLRGFRCSLIDVGNGRHFTIRDHAYLEDAIAEALNAAKEGDDHAA